MDLESDLILIKNNDVIINYFETSKRSLYDFVKLYIEVDKVLSSNVCITSNILADKLDDIKKTLTHNYSQISNLQTNLISNHSNIIEILQHKVDSLSGVIKDVTNGDIKSMFNDLRKQIESNSDLDKIKISLENFKEKMENINLQKLNEYDRKSIDLQSNLLQTFDSMISNKVANIETNINNISEHFSNNSSKKGQLAEGILLSLITETFGDTEVIDTSQTANSGDIQLVKENKPTILIDSKNFGSKTVPKRDLDKFYGDIQNNNCSGILCNAFGGIANKGNFEIDIVDKNILIFMHSHKFDKHLFELAVSIIYKLHEQIKDRSNEGMVVDDRLYHNLKIEYNYYLQSFRHHLDIIKSNVNSLSQLSFNLLDNFFKRKTSIIELKAFMCHLCGTGCKTEKILKTHLKKIHKDKETIEVEKQLIKF